MKRIIQPELLDELPANDPRAMQSRRDLQRINFFMGNVKSVQRNLEKYFPKKPPKKIMELGAGDGSFMLRLAKRLSNRWKNIEVIFVDQQRLVSAETENEFRALGWKTKTVCVDVFEWLPLCASVDCMIANLFLHHFQNERLSELLRMAAEKTKVFVACEPRRYRWSVAGTKLLWLIGCNDVTRHDALVSVHAGFQGNELSGLWPQSTGWKVEESETSLASHGFVAARP